MLAPGRVARGENETSGMVRSMSGAQESELDRLEKEYRRLQDQVSAQAWELNLLRARFARYEAALRGSQVTVYTQDRDLRYTSISNPMLGRSVEQILGRTDAEILTLDGSATIIAAKREVLASGEAKRAEVPFEDAPGIRWHDLHIEPLRNEAGEVVGLTCASVEKSAGGHPGNGTADSTPCGLCRWFFDAVWLAATGARCVARSSGARELVWRFARRTHPVSAWW